MKVSTLANSSFDDIVDCFLASFENYYVKMPTEKSYYEKRWKAAKVQFDLSYGMYDQGVLVGFIIHGIDTRNGIYTAFNTGTGVLPAYRGRKIVKAIYDFALKDLKSHGIQKTSLEVITKNAIAIRAYKGVGFNICKDFYCYAGTINILEAQAPEIQEITPSAFNWDELINQEYYSWDFQKESIVEGPNKYYQVFHNQVLESYFIINPENNYLAQCDVLKNDMNAWKRLFAAIKIISEEVKIINVDGRLKNKIETINLVGLQNTVNQFEMELFLD